MTYPGASTFPDATTYPGAPTDPPPPPTVIAPPPPSNREDRFRVLAYDICANQLICELPANGLTFDSRLNDAGAIGFTLDLTDPASAAQCAPFLQYYTNRVMVGLYVERDGVLVWGGFQTTTNYTHTSSAAIPVQGREWLAFFEHRVICRPLDAATYPNGLDPAALLSKAVIDCQDDSIGGPGSNIGITVVGGSSHVPWIKPSYTLFQTFASQVIADCVAGVTPGTGKLDVWMNVAYTTAGAPSVTLNILSPRAGRIAGDSGLAFDLLDAVDFTWPSDFGQACNLLVATGGGSGQVAPRSIVRAPGVPTGGLGQAPRLDKVISHSNVVSQAQLDGIAAGEVQEFAGSLTTPTVTVPTADPNTPLGTWIPGDDARLFAAGFELYPGGVDQYWRIVQHAVTVPDDGVPTVTITFNAPPQY